MGEGRDTVNDVLGPSIVDEDAVHEILREFQAEVILKLKVALVPVKIMWGF